MVSVKLAHSVNLRQKTLKQLTSLNIKSQKTKVRFQDHENSRFLESAKVTETAQFVGSAKFLVCFRFIETNSFTKNNILVDFQLSSPDYLFVQGVETCKLLAQEFDRNSLASAKLLLNGPLFFLRAKCEKTLFLWVKKLILLEENADLSAMVSLCFVREADSAFDLRLIGGKSDFARSLYKIYDSRESVLIELLRVNLSILEVLPTLLDQEINAPIIYGAGALNMDNWLTIQ